MADFLPEEPPLNLGGYNDSYDMTEEEIQNFFNGEGFLLCKNASYKSFPLCQEANLSLFENYSSQASNEFEYAYIVRIVVPIFFGIAVIVGVFGNSLVVIVIIINKQMRSTTNYLIFSLAIADLLFTLFCVPFTASDYIFVQWPFGSIWCKVVQYLTYVTAYASVYTLLLLSIDRYLAIVHPIYAITVRTEKNAIYAILFTWCLILLSCVPLYIVHGLSDHEACMYQGEDYHHAAFRIGFITTMYFIPLAVIVGLYLLILKRLWSQSATGGTRSVESVRGKKRVTRMVVIVIVTFIICWLPIQMVLLLKSLEMYPMTTFRTFFQIFGQSLAYMNSCINPILYAFLSDPFRKAFRKVITCFPSRRSQSMKGNLKHEGTATSRVTRNQTGGQSFPMQNMMTFDETESLAPHKNMANNNSTGSQRKLYNAESDDCFHKSGVTSTSFINGCSAKDDDISPSNSCQSNLNGVLI